MSCLNCGKCFGCSTGCSSCPNPNSCDYITNYESNLMVINKQVRQSSSNHLAAKKSLLVSKMVGQSADPKNLLVGGGPGDLIASLQKKGGRFSIRHNMRHLRISQLYKNNRGVDRKHGSYARYLARKTGNTLRRESLPDMKAKKSATNHQPRNRTGTRTACINISQVITKKHMPPELTGTEIDLNCNPTTSKACCSNRIPQINKANRTLLVTPFNYAKKYNSGDTTITGFLGNNSQVVSSTRCSNNCANK